MFVLKYAYSKDILKKIYSIQNTLKKKNVFYLNASTVCVGVRTRNWIKKKKKKIFLSVCRGFNMEIPRCNKISTTDDDLHKYIHVNNIEFYPLPAENSI